MGLSGQFRGYGLMKIYAYLLAHESSMPRTSKSRFYENISMLTKMSISEVLNRWATVDDLTWPNINSTQT